MTKPTENLTWTATGNKTDPAAIGTDGYKTTDLVPSKFLNYQLAIITEWQQFVDRAFGKTYYVEQASGDDGNDGSATYPFKTIKFACDTVEAGGYGSIVLAETGDYPIDADIDFYAKKIFIYEDTAIDANISHENYVTTVNEYYRFNLYMGSTIAIFADTITMEDVDNTKASGSDCAIASHSGSNNISILMYPSAGHGLIFTTTTPTSGNPSYIRNISTGNQAPFTSVVTFGKITTGSKGYVFDLAEMPSSLYGYAGIMDAPDFWVENGIDKTLIAASNTVFTDNGNLVGGATNPVTLTAFGDSVSVDATAMVGVIQTVVRGLFTGLMEAIVFTDITVTPTVAGGILTGLDIVISGDSKNVPINHSFYVDNGANIPIELTSQGNDALTLKNINLLTNITSLK